MNEHHAIATRYRGANFRSVQAGAGSGQLPSNLRAESDVPRIV
jgi:hypothetical protein